MNNIIVRKTIFYNKLLTIQLFHIDYDDIQFINFLNKFFETIKSFTNKNKD